MKNSSFKFFKVIVVIDVILAVINDSIIRGYLRNYYNHTAIYSNSIRNLMAIPIVLFPVLLLPVYIFCPNAKKAYNYMCLFIAIVWLVYLICIFTISVNNIDFIREIIVWERKYTVGYVIDKMKILLS